MITEAYYLNIIKPFLDTYIEHTNLTEFPYVLRTWKIAKHKDLIVIYLLTESRKTTIAVRIMSNFHKVVAAEFNLTTIDANNVHIMSRDSSLVALSIAWKIPLKMIVEHTYTPTITDKETSATSGDLRDESN